jgi:hypothetical protein
VRVFGIGSPLLGFIVRPWQAKAGGDLGHQGGAFIVNRKPFRHGGLTFIKGVNRFMAQRHRVQLSKNVQRLGLAIGKAPLQRFP